MIPEPNKTALARDRYDPGDLLSQLAGQQPGKDGFKWCVRLRTDIDEIIALLPDDESQHTAALSRLASFLADIRRLDNAFQDSCEEEARRAGWDLSNAMLHIAWLSAADDIITVGYWGTVV